MFHKMATKMSPSFSRLWPFTYVSFEKAKAGNNVRFHKWRRSQSDSSVVGVAQLGLHYNQHFIPTHQFSSVMTLPCLIKRFMNGTILCVHGNDAAPQLVVLQFHVPL